MQAKQMKSYGDSPITRGKAIYNIATGLTGIVGKVQENTRCIHVPVGLDSGNRLVLSELTMPPESCRPATQEEKRALQQALNRASRLGRTQVPCPGGCAGTGLRNLCPREHAGGKYARGGIQGVR